MEEKIEIGAKTLEEVVCANCNKTVPGAEALSFRDKDGNDVYLCEECNKAAEEEFKKEVENPNYIGAIALGVLAGIATGVIWYFIEILTERIIGYVAIGVGYVVARAVILGSGKKRGTVLQIISAIITLLSIVGASYFSAVYFVNDYVRDMFTEAGETFNEMIWLSPFDKDVISMVVSPVGVLIWAFGIYIAYRTPKKRTI